LRPFPDDDSRFHGAIAERLLHWSAMRLTALICVCFLSICFSSGVRADDAVPDQFVVRKHIDDLIANTPGHKATLGTLHGVMALSIAYGAAAWNAQDHQACSDFYAKTGKSLCSSFAGADQATSPARHLLDDLKTALDRVEQSNDADTNAWTMRFVFDKTEVEAVTEAERSARLLAVGLETLGRSQFQDSANAFAAAADALHELDGQPLDQIPAECRYSPLALSDALFAQKHFKEAAAAVEDGLHFFPELPDRPMDLSKHFADPAIYHLLAEDLQDTAVKNPEDQGIQLLAGYHLFFTGHHDTAKPFFERVLKMNPNDTAAKRMLEQYDPSHPKAPAGAPLPPGNQA
jgi:tetratricopeptide (TPR) repeat protein